MLHSKSVLTSLIIASFLISCFGDEQPETFDYSEKIIGTWQQDRTFNLVDATRNPAAYDWFDVEDGFILSLFEDRSFIYTKFGTCTSGNYVYDSILHKIEFFFDCEVEFQGEMLDKIIEDLEQDNKQNNKLTLFPRRVKSQCEVNCAYIFKRIE